MSRLSFFNENKCNNIFLNMLDLHSSYGTLEPHENFIKKFINKSNIPVENQVLLNHEYLCLKRDTNKFNLIKNSHINEIINLIENNKNYYNSYNDVHFDKTLRFFKNGFRNIAILGDYDCDYTPWIESVIINLIPDAKITLIDYQQREYENKNITWKHMVDYLKAPNLEKFDMVINYKTIEKTGLGRFGEEISLDSDLETVQLMKCLLRKNGILLMTLSLNKYGEHSYVGYNSGRLYSSDRLDIIKKNWNILIEEMFNFGSDLIMALEKI
ncbi:unnamed protein product [Brachionus calyciflorus]|uniref:Uncharacterized protein n=1 Tax=Brachionus calyciflorus TaxID=104777 RepID=A0A814L7H3_9BILA|nr:unnamed protein product [Brachionus calyciflorus]